MSRKATIWRAVRRLFPYALAIGFLTAAVVAGSHGVYWLCIAGVAGFGVMAAFILVTTKSGPVTLDAWKDQQIIVDRNKID